MINSSSDNVKKLNSINRRMFITGSLKFFIMVGIISRLFFLQVKENKKYLTLSDKNRIREWKLAPVRGEFHDYFGNVIAGNFEAYQLHVIPEQVENFKYVIYRLKDLLELSDTEFKKVLKKKKESKPWETLIVSNNLSWEKFSKINNHLYDLNGVKPVISISRNYPNDIERYEVNAYGRRISQLEFQKGKKGQTLKLTVDTEIQKLANELLKDKAGSICVMDIFTGEVIAMHSSPSFDPNLFVFGISQDNWQIIRNDPMKPLLNKTLQGRYSPGSTLKPIVALSALENGIINTKFTVRCTGKTELYDQTYHCWKKEGHGYVSLRNAMKMSCDTYFYEIARKLGVDKLSETAKKFGLGKKVFDNLFEIEKDGLIPNTQWKKNALGKGWLLGETIITGIGQGYIQTTPIQLCLMTAQIANGGYKIYPKILIDDKDKIKPSDYYTPLYKDSRNIKIIQDAMFGSTNEVMGTSYRSRIDNPKYQFAGKTGTAQVKKITERERELDLKTSEIPYEQRDHALYIAYGPYVNPRYALSIVVEHGGNGSTTAAPMAKRLFKLIIDRHEIRQSINQKKYLEI